MKLVLAEKPSVAQSIAKVLGAAKREDGYLEGNGYVVSWCVGHLVELAQPEVYDAKYSKWAYADLPIFPMDWQYEVSAGTKKQFGILKKLMAREDVASLVCATDAGREGELIFRLVYHKAGCRKPFERLWILLWKLPVRTKCLMRWSAKVWERLRPVPVSLRSWFASVFWSVRVIRKPNT